VRDGRFALHGLDADVEFPVFFLEPERKLGATVRFSGKSTSPAPFEATNKRLDETQEHVAMANTKIDKANLGMIVGPGIDLTGRFN
jgi:hypothetical protein